MSTRSLTVVYSDGKHVVAQYGQYDGYPDGKGSTALQFCLDYLQCHQGRELFKKKLKNVEFFKSGSCEENVYTQSGDGSNVLQMIADAPAHAKIVLEDDLEFAADSLFCEWVYVIDLDKCTFEVYEGFNKKPLSDGERFKHLAVVENGYYQVRRIITYSLDALPIEEDFLAYFCGDYRDEEDD